MKTTTGKAVVILSPGVHYERFKKYQLSNWKLLCYLLYPFAMRREASVTPHPSLQIVRALPVPTQVDGSGLDVDVHQVVNDLALNVILDAVDEKTATHIDYLDEGEIPGRRQDANDSSEGLQWGDITSKKNLSRELNFNFIFFLPVVLIWVQRLVALFVAFNSFLEIQHGFSLVTVPVVRAGHLHFLRRKENCQTANNMPDARDLWALCKNSTVMSEVIFVTHHDVRRNDAGIIAHRLDEEDLNRKVRLCLERCSTSLIQYFGTPITLAACTLKSFSSPNLRIMSRLSLVVLVASKTYKKRERFKKSFTTG